MPHPFDVGNIADTILRKLSDSLGDDVTRHVELARSQSAKLAKHAAWVAEAIKANELDEREREFFLADLEKLAEDFAWTVVALTILTLEKAWNAIVGALWGAINSAVGATIPIPRVPSP